MQVLGSEICKRLLFLNVFTGCDTIPRIFGIGKKSALQKLMKGNPALQSCAKFLSSHGQDTGMTVDSRCVFMVSVQKQTWGQPSCCQIHVFEKRQYDQKLHDTRTTASNIFGSEITSPGNAMKE